MARHASILTEAVAADMERLWSRSCVPAREIAERLNQKHGTTFEARNVEWHARRRAWTRDMVNQSVNQRHAREERLFLKSLNRPRVLEEAVRIVPPGTHGTGGFRLGGPRRGMLAWTALGITGAAALGRHP